MDKHKLLDLPAVPEIFVNECLDATHERIELPMIQDMRTPDLTNQNPATGQADLKDHTSDTIKESYNLLQKPRYMEWFDGSNKSFCTIRKYPFSDELYAWIKENIYSDLDNMITYQLGHQVWKNGDVIWPHTDGRRGEFVLIYLVDAGGADVYTVWYQVEGRSLLLPPSTHYFKCTTLESIYSTKIPTGHWTLNDTRILHSVQFLDGPRIAITIGMNEQEVEKFCAQHNIDFVK